MKRFLAPAWRMTLRLAVVGLAGMTASVWAAGAPASSSIPSGAASNPPSTASAQAATSNPPPVFQEVLATPALLSRVRQGGYTMYLRHGPTENTRPDRLPEVDLGDCATQRPLSEEGRKVMVQVGKAFRQAGLTANRLHVSPLCRAMDSARAAFPDQTGEVDPLLMYVGNFTAARKAPVIAHTKALLSDPPPRGSNRLLLAHAPNLMELIGYFPKEGTLVIFQPQGPQGMSYLGSIPPDHWERLLR